MKILYIVRCDVGKRFMIYKQIIKSWGYKKGDSRLIFMAYNSTLWIQYEAVLHLIMLTPGAVINS